MDKPTARIICFFLLGICLMNVDAHADLFPPQPLVQMPGSNTQFSVNIDEEPSLITWINYSNDIYSLYVQQIFPEPALPTLIKSSANQICCPNLTGSPWNYTPTLKLVWSEYDSLGWSLNYRGYSDDAWDETIRIVEGAQNPIKSSAGYSGISWINDGSLYYMRLIESFMDSTWQSPTLIDSGGCNNPVMFEDYNYYLELAYEKQSGDSKLIRKCAWSYALGEFTFETISTAELNRNPRRGPERSLSFETYYDSTWRASYSDTWYYFDFNITSNQILNFYHPVYLSIPQPTLFQRETFLYNLLVFECDSLEDGLEIMALMNIPYEGATELINISNLAGDDRNPVISESYYGDSLEIAILWEHVIAGGREIWWARDRFAAPTGSADNEAILPTFALSDNFPNPFNAGTIIKYELNENQYIGLNIWNVNGQLVASQPIAYQSAGTHVFEWNPVSLSSGVYFYSLYNSQTSMTRKCLLVK